MAQTSTTLLASKSHIANVTGTDISFTATGTEYKITSTSTTLSGFAVRDLITVTGTTNNNTTFTVKTVSSANQLIVEEIVTTETADGSTTTTLDHTGFVSDKAKGDGYERELAKDLDDIIFGEEHPKILHNPPAPKV